MCQSGTDNQHIHHSKHGLPWGRPRPLGDVSECAFSPLMLWLSPCPSHGKHAELWTVNCVSTWQPSNAKYSFQHHSKLTHLQWYSTGSPYLSKTIIIFLKQYQLTPFYYYNASWAYHVFCHSSCQNTYTLSPLGGISLTRCWGQSVLWDLPSYIYPLSQSLKVLKACNEQDRTWWTVILWQWFYYSLVDLTR